MGIRTQLDNSRFRRTHRAANILASPNRSHVIASAQFKVMLGECDKSSKTRNPCQHELRSDVNCSTKNNFLDHKTRPELLELPIGCHVHVDAAHDSSSRGLNFISENNPAHRAPKRN